MLKPVWTGRVASTGDVSRSGGNIITLNDDKDVTAYFTFTSPTAVGLVEDQKPVEFLRIELVVIIAALSLGLVLFAYIKRE